MADPSGKVQAKALVSHLLLLVLAAFTWLSVVDFPIRIASVSLDDSWQKAFGYFLKKGMQAGTDYVFTYGPLGYFNSPIYDPDLFWAGFCWEVITRSLLVYYLFQIFHPLFNPIIKVISLILINLFLPILHRDIESLIFITLVGIHLTDKNSSRVAQTVGLITLSALSLGKFVLFVLSSIVSFFCEIRNRADHSRSFFSPILIFMLVYCIGWVFARQSLMNLPRYIFSSLQIATGYNESMGVTGDLVDIWISVILLALFFTILGHIARVRKERVQLLVLVTGLLLAWKQGFTRQDNHTVIFFGYALVSILIVVSYFGYGIRQRGFEYAAKARIFVVGVVLMCIFGSILGIARSSWTGVVFQEKPGKILVVLSGRKIISNLVILTHLLNVHRTLDRYEKQIEKRWKLPLTVFRVGNSTIDTMSYQQGYLLLNHLNWHPRPIFQSYSAYTSYLAQRNADFFQRSAAPKYVLYKSQPLDNRLPATEDGLALLEILKRYVPDSTEQSFLLLKKSAGLKKTFTVKQLKKGGIRFDQEISIDKNFRHQLLQLDIRETFAGKIRKLFYRSPYIFISLKMKSGVIHKCRLVPALAKNGFLLTPLILKTEDVVHFYQASGGHNLMSFTIETESPGVYFQNQIGMEIRSLSPPDPSSFSASQFALLRDSINSGLSFQMKEVEEATQIVPLDISERTASAYDHLALFEEGLVEADPVVLLPAKYKIVLVGYGSKAGKDFPVVEFYLDRKLIGTLTISKLDQYELPFETTEEKKATFGLSLINDDQIGEEDRNVFIKRFYVERLE
jgi:hypothetical protein